VTSPNELADAILTIQDLSVHYVDGTQGLRGLSLTVQSGQRVALLGPNGAGKTSLLLAVLNAVHWHGRIVVDGVELMGRSAEVVRGRCGLTFQDADDQLFMPTLLEDVAFGPLNQGLAPAAAETKARATIAAVGLAGLESRSAHHLSGGQKRVAALATVLAMDVKLLLLDEPGASLDARTRRKLGDLLAGRPEAMLLATHDLDLAGRLCQRAVVLEDGKVAVDAPMREVVGDAALLGRYGLA
jgi:cobalt/nickel transport system ATP-binding protein